MIIQIKLKVTCIEINIYYNMLIVSYNVYIYYNTLIVSYNVYIYYNTLIVSYNVYIYYNTLIVSYNVYIYRTGWRITIEQLSYCEPAKRTALCKILSLATIWSFRSSPIRCNWMNSKREQCFCFNFRNLITVTFSR